MTKRFWRNMIAACACASALVLGSLPDSGKAAVIDMGNGTVDLGNLAFLDGQWRTGSTTGSAGWTMDPSGVASLPQGSTANLYYLVLQFQNRAGFNVTLDWKDQISSFPAGFDVSAQVLAWQSSGVAPTIDLTAVDLQSLFGSITLNDAIALLPLNSGASLSTTQVTGVPLVTGGSLNSGTGNFGLFNSGDANINLVPPVNVAILLGGQNTSSTTAELGSVSVNEVPVPASLPLVLAGIAAVVAIGRRRR